MDVPYPVYTKNNAPAIVNTSLDDAEVLTITLVGGDPDGDILSLTVTDCPIELQPTLITTEINYGEIPVVLLNTHYDWLYLQPNTKFFKYEFTIIGTPAAFGDHEISFQITDGRGGENFVKAIISVIAENSQPYLSGCII